MLVITGLNSFYPFQYWRLTFLFAFLTYLIWRLIYKVKLHKFIGLRAPKKLSDRSVKYWVACN
jgi:hypothetical protein